MTENNDKCCHNWRCFGTAGLKSELVQLNCKVMVKGDGNDGCCLCVYSHDSYGTIQLLEIKNQSKLGLV